MSSYPVGAGGFYTSTRPMIFSWSKNSRDIEAPKLTEQLDLSHNPLGVDQVFESLGDFLNGDLGFDGMVEG
jgi:hypothetical protein